jgi:IS5 family transposase
MFKILLRQRWYNPSDAAVEVALCDRLSCVRFVGLSLDHDKVPDAATICRFRRSLVERNILKRLLDKRTPRWSAGDFWCAKAGSPTIPHRERCSWTDLPAEFSLFIDFDIQFH